MGYEQSKIRLRGLENLWRQVCPHHSPPFQWWGDCTNAFQSILSCWASAKHLCVAIERASSLRSEWQQAAPIRPYPNTHVRRSTTGLARSLLGEGEAPAEPTSPDWGVFTAEAVPLQTKPACAGCVTLRRQGLVWKGAALAANPCPSSSFSHRGRSGRCSSKRCNYFFKVHQWWEDYTMSEENLLHHKTAVL